MQEGKGHHDLSLPELQNKVRELAPWFLPFHIRDDLYTMNMKSGLTQEAASRIEFRSDLIVGTALEILGGDLADTDVLDIGCNDGFFSLDIAHRGVKHVDGFDLRPENIAKARFLADHYGIENVDFSVSDADDFVRKEQWDVVLNLGVLYHVVNPLQFIRQTYELCRRFAIIDTIVHSEPISAYILMGDKNVDMPAEGREDWEFHPTYRGAIDTIRYAGFSEVYEILGDADPPHKLYAGGNRRSFLAVK
jgi:2-polyprenyl-3-methyl-5-hydroxy-6-metoxy-1,4-benzoquinol methylase